MARTCMELGTPMSIFIFPPRVKKLIPASLKKAGSCCANWHSCACMIFRCYGTLNPAIVTRVKGRRGRPACSLEYYHEPYLLRIDVRTQGNRGHEKLLRVWCLCRNLP